MEQPTKRCTRCGKELPATKFWFNYRRGKHGLSSICKKCEKEEKEMGRPRKREAIKELHPYYVCLLLGHGVKDVPPEMVEFKRFHVLLKREIKKQEQDEREICKRLNDEHNKQHRNRRIEFAINHYKKIKTNNIDNLKIM